MSVVCLQFNLLLKKDVLLLNISYFLHAQIHFFTITCFSMVFSTNILLVPSVTFYYMLICKVITEQIFTV